MNLIDYRRYFSDNYYMKNKLLLVNLILISALLFATSCGNNSDVYSLNHVHSVQIVIEDNASISIEKSIYEAEAGDDITLDLSALPGFHITGCDYADYDLEKISDSYSLCLHDVKYSSVVTIYTQQNEFQISYKLNYPEFLSDSVAESFIEAPEKTHIKLNTCRFREDFLLEGYTLYSWNSSPDGTGLSVSLGSRVNTDLLTDNTLYGQWAKWTDPSYFQYEDNSEGITITSYTGSTDTLVIPSVIDKKKVTRISENVFSRLKITSVILPPTIKVLDNSAFTNCDIEEVILFDNIEKISDYSFKNCSSIKTIRINAAADPVYSGSYYATFPDKMDYLEQLSDKYPDNKKLVLFSGSSARFGYDSPLIEEAFPEYKVANIGVFAYTNALPQLDLILLYMDSGDILLDSPEFDASRRQFCVLNKFDDKFFNMIEEDYSLLEKLDIRNYSGVLSAFGEYLLSRRGMSERSYDLSPSDFDENFNPVSEKSYNAQGDYCLYRPNASDDLPVFDLPVDYEISAFPSEYIDALNNEAQKFIDKGINFYFTYAPRNIKALSDISTDAARKELDDYLRASLTFPVISDIEESLYPGRYLFETDNHLSTEGVQIRTNRIISDLKKQLDK